MNRESKHRLYEMNISLDPEDIIELSESDGTFPAVHRSTILDTNNQIYIDSRLDPQLDWINPENYTPWALTAIFNKEVFTTANEIWKNKGDITLKFPDKEGYVYKTLVDAMKPIYFPNLDRMALVYYFSLVSDE